MWKSVGAPLILLLLSGVLAIGLVTAHRNPSVGFVLVVASSISIIGVWWFNRNHIVAASWFVIVAGVSTLNGNQALMHAIAIALQWGAREIPAVSDLLEGGASMFRRLAEVPTTRDLWVGFGLITIGMLVLLTLRLLDALEVLLLRSIATQVEHEQPSHAWLRNARYCDRIGRKIAWLTGRTRKPGEN